MPRRVYTEKDQARVAVLLQATEGNIKRTARESGLAISTVRSWRDKWEKEGYPEPVEEAIPQAREDILLDLKEVIALSVTRLKETLADRSVKVSPKDMAWITGVFVDKVRVIEGHATTRHETVHALPSPEETRAQLRGFLAEIVEAADTRQADVIDAGLVEDAQYEVVETPELPAPASN